MHLERQPQVGHLLPRLDHRGDEARLLQLGGVHVQEQGGAAAVQQHELEGRLAEELAELRLRPDPGRDPEEIQRRLGQARVAPAAERLVAAQGPARQAHDRLEDRGHLPPAEQLGQLPRALDELLRQLHVAQGHRGRLEARLVGLVDLLPPDPELHLREVEDVSFAQRGLADALAVHERAVLAPEVADVEGAASQEELAVLLRHRVRGEGQGEVGEASDPEGQGLYRDAPQLPAALHEALEVPPERACVRPGSGTGNHCSGKGIIAASGPPRLDEAGPRGGAGGGPRPPAGRFPGPGAGGDARRRPAAALRRVRPAVGALAARLRGAPAGRSRGPARGGVPRRSRLRPRRPAAAGEPRRGRRAARRLAARHPAAGPPARGGAGARRGARPPRRARGVRGGAGAGPGRQPGVPRRAATGRRGRLLGGGAGRVGLRRGRDPPEDRATPSRPRARPRPPPPTPARPSRPGSGAGCPGG